MYIRHWWSYIKADLANFFPGGLEQTFELSDDELKSTIKDPEKEYLYVQILLQERIKFFFNHRQIDV